MSDAVIGKEVDGYRIQAVLGRGGMGTVYKAEDVNLSRTVAIKRINPGQQDRESFIHRFRSEAQALARIDSSHIVGVYALRETDIGLLIVMEYVEGGTLKAPVESYGALAPNQAVPILEQTLQAFHDAHSAGVIHRDIKPENVMLTKDGMVKVTDFGIAKLRQPDSGETVTQGGQGGTLKYMSPEQISNISAVDARSDIYSLGMTAYEILSGDLPFKESDTDFDIMRKVVEGEIPPPDELNPDIPSGLAQWVVGAIQKQQDERYQSAEEMLNALRDADRQVDHTVTQPEWEVDDGSADVDRTQTAPPSDEDRTQTVVPDGEDDSATESDGETVLDPNTGLDDGGRPPVQDAGKGTAVDVAAATETDESEKRDTNWAAIGGGVAVVLLVAVGAVVAFTQWGGGGGESATLSLTTTPPGATVLVHGYTVGTTPLAGYALQAGAVQLQIEKNGYEPLDSTFTVQAGGQVAISDVQLARAGGGGDGSEAVAENVDESGAVEQEQSEPGSAGSGTSSTPTTTTAESGASNRATTQVEESSPESGGVTEAMGIVDVTLEPTGSISVDGENRGSGRIELSAGEHTVTCSHPEGGSAETTITIVEGETESLICYTEQEVNVNTNGAWGQIWLNGINTEKRANAGKGRLSLPPGAHQIEVRRRTLEGFEVKGGQVKIERGGESRIEQFSGTSYEVEVSPTFERVEYAVVFNVANS